MIRDEIICKNIIKLDIKYMNFNLIMKNKYFN